MSNDAVKTRLLLLGRYLLQTTLDVALGKDVVEVVPLGIHVNQQRYCVELTAGFAIFSQPKRRLGFGEALFTSSSGVFCAQFVCSSRAL
jgi:hypothetical protein